MSLVEGAGHGLVIGAVAALVLGPVLGIAERITPEIATAMLLLGVGALVVSDRLDNAEGTE